jgi:type 2 lantibiotic biosynthesis protein LanM
VVVRSTNVYGLLWYESFHPDLLRDGLDRDRYFDRLWAEVARRPDFRRVVAAERRDLLRGDIPSFSASPADRTLVTSEGEPLPDFLRAPSLDVVRDRVAQLGEDDLATQTWIVEASLSTLLMDREDRIARPAWRASADGTIGGQRLLALAQAAGRRLHDLALQTDAGASWLGVGPLDATTWGVLPSGTDLYAGTGGIALFLAHLGGVTGEPVHTQLARRAVMSLRSQSRTFLDSVRDEEETGMPPAAVGAFEGLASVVYALTHLGVLWDEPGLLDEAEELVAALPPLVARDDRLDVIYGSAGCLLALLSLHAVRPTPRILQVATACGERLGATCRATSPGTAWTTLDGEPPLAGFSHGVAGIAYSLLKLAARTSDERFRVTALDALAYERSLFDAELDNWADLRTFGGTRPAKAPENVDATDRTSMVAWCHGAPGIGLARLGALEVLDDPQVRDEIDIALHTTTAYGFAMNHSLCHGALGNVDLLLTAAQVLDRPQDHEALEEAISVIAASIEANGWVTGVPLGVETPGLMTGLAGMGYQLLRLAEPGQMPSVLLLEPPSGSGPA